MTVHTALSATLTDDDGDAVDIEVTYDVTASDSQAVDFRLPQHGAVVSTSLDDAEALARAILELVDHHRPATR